MGRKRNIFIRDFYKYNNNSDESMCKVCSMKFKGSHVTNLKRHVISAHFDLYEKESQQFEQNTKRHECETKKVKFTVEYSQKEITDLCIQFLTHHSQPLSFFDCSAFKVLTEQIFNGLKMTPISSENIMALVNEKCVEIKDNIRKTIKGKIISIKIDTATQHGRSILVINAQIIEKNELKVYTLSIKEIFSRQTEEKLNEQLEDVLNEYEINKKQIYSITIDNGRNMFKAVNLLETFTNNEEELLSETNENSDVNAENLVDRFCERNHNIFSIECAAHTLQLAVDDFLSTNKIAIINRVRQVIITLRTPNFRNTLQMLDLIKPELDIPTKWSSTFVMLNKFIEYKDFCTVHVKEPLTEEEWIDITGIVSVLKPIYETAFQLQQEQMLLGDFYKVWCNLKTELASKNTEIAKIILNCIEKRELQLINPKILNTALFLDPRHRRTLTSYRIEDAINQLKKLAAQMIFIKHVDDEIRRMAPQNQNTSTSVDEDIKLSTNSSLIREFIKSLEVDASSEELTKAYTEINTYEAHQVNIDMDLIDYWEDRRHVFPFLRKLAYIIHAVPATQATYKRAVSSLKLILDYVELNLSEEHLRSIIFVKLNQE